MVDHATVSVSDILESDRLDAGEIQRLRSAAYSSEAAWRELKKATGAPAGRSLGLSRRIKRAAGLLVLGRPQAAVKEIDEAKAGGEPVGALILGRAYLEMRDPKKAADAFEAGLKKAKGDLDLTLGAIEAQRESGDAQGALKEAQAIEKKHGGSADVLYQVGACQEALGDYGRAMDTYEDALAIDPANARALFRLAYNHELRGSLGVAEDYYKACTDLNPTYCNALVNYGLMLEDMSRYKDAVEVYHRILCVRPNHPRARMFLKDAEASLDMYYDEDQEKKSDRRNAILRIPVTDFELSVRARNCLNKMNIRNLGDLVTKTEEELLAYKNFGETSLQEIKQMLAQKGLRLGMFREGVAGTAVPAAAPDTEKRSGDDELLRKPISDLELSVRSRNCMERLNVRTIGDLTAKSEAELLAVKNFGATSLNEIKQRLGELSLSLAPDAPGTGVAAGAIEGVGPLAGLGGLGALAAAAGLVGRVATRTGEADEPEEEVLGASVVSADQVEEDDNDDDVAPLGADAVEDEG